MITDDELKVIEERAAAASEAWADGRDTKAINGYCRDASREDVPALVTEVRRLRKGLELIARLKVEHSGRCWPIAGDYLTGGEREYSPLFFHEHLPASLVQTSGQPPPAEGG